MKKSSTLFIKFSKSYLMLFLVLAMVTVMNIQKVSAQTTLTGTCIVLHQPCNNDGVLLTKITSAATFPLKFVYTENNKTTITHSNIHTLSDTLRGIQTISSVTVTDSLNRSFQFQPGITTPFTITITRTTATCPQKGGSATVTVNTTAKPDSVQWFTFSEQTPPNSTISTGQYIGSGNPMFLPATGGSTTFYTAVVYYKGCVSSSNTYILYTSGLTLKTASTTANCTNGAATLNTITGGTAPYTYLWANGANTSSINGLKAGSYGVTVTDAQGCYSSTSVSVTQAITISVTMSVKQPTCLQNDGSIISFGAGGVSPYTYQYSNGVAGQTVCCLTGGSTISVIATDVNGCFGSYSKTLYTTTPITVTYITKPSSCTKPTGSATLTIKGGTKPYKELWGTYPAQSGTTISNLPAGSYYFKVTDTTGCLQTGTVVIPPISTISAYGYKKDAVCANGPGSAVVTVTGSNPPFKFAWNTGATSSTIANLNPGNYTCTVTDSLSCSVIKYINILQTSPISVNIKTTQASCLYTSDGIAFATSTGGKAPYSYLWSNRQTGSTASGLAKGDYYVYVKDSNGCYQQGHTVVGYNYKNDSCYCVVKGKVYLDSNGNCQYDNGEKGIAHVMIHCSGGLGYTFTDPYGNYSFLLPTGNYTLSENVEAFYPLATCQNNLIQFNIKAKSGCDTIINIANIIQPIHDIHIIPSLINQPVPGFNYSQGLIVQNDGTGKETNIQMGFKHDGQLQYLNSSPNVYTQIDPVGQPNWYSVKSGFDTLLPGKSVIITRNFLVPTDIPLNTAVNFYDTAAYAPPMSNWLLDYTPWNNVSSFQTKIIGSFDPNYLEVKPVGTGNEGYIGITDSVLDYVIHFQNDGNYYAQNIVLIDTLDKNLNQKSVKPGYSNYSYSADISDNGILKITFNNINLPWQSLNDAASRGMITYSIKQQPNLAPLTKIQNTAYAFFDFNAPVATNATLNTIKSNVGVNQLKIDNGQLKIYPNPTSSVLNISTKNEDDLKLMNIYDLTGRMIKQQTATSNQIQHVDVSNLTSGIYFIEIIKSNSGRFTAKFVKN